MLTGVVSAGTGACAAIPGYTIAGKTGTARKAVDGGYSTGTMASFIGYAPAAHPKLAAIVVLDEPASTVRRHGGRAGVRRRDAVRAHARRRRARRRRATRSTTRRARRRRQTGTTCTDPAAAAAAQALAATAAADHADDRTPPAGPTGATGATASDRCDRRRRRADAARPGRPAQPAAHRRDRGATAAATPGSLPGNTSQSG